MAHILVTAGSNSSTSINFQLARYTAGRLNQNDILLRELAQLNIPTYSEDIERNSGFPSDIEALYADLKAARGLVFSVNEHNGAPSAFAKNVLDWLSRKERNFLEGLPVLLLSTSPGRGGAQSARKAVEELLPRFGAEVVATFSLPSFRHMFQEGEGITDAGLQAEFRMALETFKNH